MRSHARRCPGAVRTSTLGNPPARTRSVKPGVGAVPSKPGKSAANARSTNRGESLPPISACESGSSSIVCTRPASESGAIEPLNRSTEAVIMNCPGRRHSSTTCLSDRIKPGARWISSMTAVGCSRTNPIGSFLANCLDRSSSRLTNCNPRSLAIRRARVVLPDWRGPTIATMRVSVSASRTKVSAWRARNRPRSIVWLGIQFRLTRNIGASDSEQIDVHSGV